MLARITEQSLLALEHAETCRRRAQNAGDPMTGREYQRLEQSWMRLAQSYQVAEQISGYLEWQAKRLQAPPGVDLD